MRKDQKWEEVVALIPKKENGKKVLLLAERLKRLDEKRKRIKAEEKELAKTEAETLKEISELCKGIDARRCPHPELTMTGEVIFCVACNRMIDYT